MAGPGPNMPIATSIRERQECMVMAGITSQAQSTYVDEDGPHPESDELAGSQQSQERAAKSLIGRQQAAYPSTAGGSVTQTSTLVNIFNDTSSSSTASIVTASTLGRETVAIADGHAPYRPGEYELSQQETRHFAALQNHAKGTERLVSGQPPVRGGAHKLSARKSHKQGSASVSSAASGSADPIITITDTGTTVLPAAAIIPRPHPPSASPRRHSTPPVPQSRASTSRPLPSPRSKSADTAGVQLQDSIPLPSSSSASHSTSVPSKRKKKPNPGTEAMEDDGGAPARFVEATKRDRVLKDNDADHDQQPQDDHVREKSQAPKRRGSSHRSATPKLRLSDIQDDGESQEPHEDSTAGFADIINHQETQNAIEGRARSQMAKHAAREPTPFSSFPQAPPETRGGDSTAVDASSTGDISAHLSVFLPTSETTPPPGEKHKGKGPTARLDELQQVFPRLAGEENDNDEDDDEEGADSEAYIAATLTASQHRVRASQVGQKLPSRNESTSPARIINERQQSTAHEEQAPEAMTETIRSKPTSQTPQAASTSEQREPHASEGHGDTEQRMQVLDEQSTSASSSQLPKKRKPLTNPGPGWVKPAMSQSKIDPREKVLTSSSETESDNDENARNRDDDEELPPPLLQRRKVEMEPRLPRAQGKTQFKKTQTAYGKTPVGKSGKASHPSPRRTAIQKAAQKTAQKALQSRVAFAASPDGSTKATRGKRSAAAPAEGKAARRSSRHSGGAPILKPGDEIFALKDFKECIKRGKEVITYDGHVAYVGYDTIWLTENQEFAETQDAIADKSGAYENIWQIIVYCRNCPKPPGRSMPPSDVLDEERAEPEGLTEDDLKDWRYFEKKRRQGYPESSCAAKVVFELRLNTKSYSKSTWVLRSRADHCMECISNESNVGLGQPDYEEAREDYYATAEAQWESKLETLLEVTKSFKKPPVIDDSGYNLASNSFLGDIEEAEDHPEARRKKSKSSSCSTLPSVPRQPSGDLGDDEEDARQASRLKSLKRKRPDGPLPGLPDDEHRTSTPTVSESVVGEDEQDIEEEKPEFEEEGQVDDHHGADFDHLMDHYEAQSRDDPGPEYEPGDIEDFPIQHDERSSAPPEPTPKTKRQKLAAKAAAPPHIPASPPSPPSPAPPPPKRSGRLSKNGAAVSPKNARPPPGRDAARSTTNKTTKREKAARDRPSDRLELEPGTLLSDLELDESVQTMLDALKLKTLADLHAAIRGNSRIFQHDMDVPVEDLLLFASSQQAIQAYHSNRKWEKKDDDDEAMLVDDLIYDGEEELRDKPRHTRRLVAILKNAKVLTRAMHAIDWSAEA